MTGDFLILFYFRSFRVLKRFAQILALATPMLLVACNTGSSSTTTATGGTTTTTTSTGYSGTYTGTVTGLNAGPVTFIVSSGNVVSGSFSITNRQVDCASRGGTCETVVTGTVDASGNIKGDFVDSGIATMHFNGKIVGDTITAGTWGEYIHDPVPDGAFSASRPAGSGGTTTTTTSSGSGTCQGSYAGSIDPPTHEVRIANRNRQLASIGYALTGNDAVDNAATGGGGEDGGIYLFGAFAFETDANCNVIKSRGNIFGVPTTASGKVNADKSFSLFAPEAGPLVGAVDGNNHITGQQQEFGKEWVHGVLNGTFTPGGHI
jgi:hypothetical protein